MEYLLTEKYNGKKARKVCGMGCIRKNPVSAKPGFNGSAMLLEREKKTEMNPAAATNTGKKKNSMGGSWVLFGNTSGAEGPGRRVPKDT